MSTINNLSFYAITDSAVTKRQLEIAASECNKSPLSAHCTSAALAYEYTLYLYENVVRPCNVRSVAVLYEYMYKSIDLKSMHVAWLGYISLQFCRRI